MSRTPPQSPVRNKPLPLLVTGAAGFIGRRVVARLATAGGQVVAMDRVVPDGGWPEGVEFRQADLTRELPGLEGEWNLVHLAWNMNRGDAAGQAESVTGFSRLLSQGELVGVVGMGSAEEYGEREGRLTEDMAPGSRLSAYGQAKYDAGCTLHRWAAESGKRAFWLRPFIVYGPGQQGNMAIPYALRCAREGRPAEFSEGLQYRDFVHVDDVAAGIAAAAQQLANDGPPFAVCNLGCGVPVRLRDVLERIANNTGSGDLFRFGARPMRAGEPEEQVADVNAARELLGWRAGISWEAGVDELCREPEKDNHV